MAAGFLPAGFRIHAPARFRAPFLPWGAEGANTATVPGAAFSLTAAPRNIVAILQTILW